VSYQGLCLLIFIIRLFNTSFSQSFIVRLSCAVDVGLNVAVGRSLVSSGVVHVDNYIIQVSSFGILRTHLNTATYWHTSMADCYDTYDIW